MTGPIQKLLWSCIALMIPVICFAVHIPSLDMTSPKMFLGYLLFVLIVVFYLGNRFINRSIKTDQKIDTASLSMAAAAFLMVFWIWFLVLPDSTAYREFIRILPGLMLAIIFWQSGISVNQQRMIQLTFAITTFLVALGGIAQIAGLDPVAWQYSFLEGVFSTMGHPNVLAPCLIIGMACQWAIGSNTNKPVWCWFWWSFIIPIQFFCLILTFSKGAWVGVAVSLILTSALFSSRKTRIRVALVSLVAGLIVIVCISFRGGSIQRVLSDNSLRPAIWKSSLNMLETPGQWITGRGPGSWFVYFPTSRSKNFLNTFRRTENIRHAHNEFIELLTEIGLAGLFLLLILFAIYLRLVIRRLSEGTLCSGEKAAFFALFAVFIHSSVSVNFRSFSTWTLFWLFAGVALVSNRSEVSLDEEGSGNRLGRVSACVALIASFGALAISVFGISTSYGAMQSAAALYQGRVRMGQPDKTDAIQYMTRAVETDSSNLDAKYDLAVTLYEAGRFKESEDFFQQIGVIAPDFQRIHLNRAILLLQWGRQSRQKNLLEQAKLEIVRELELNDLDENHYMLGAIEFALGNELPGRAAFQEFLRRMDRNREEMKRLKVFRQDDAVELVKPKNWEMLLEMEKVALGKV